MFGHVKCAAISSKVPSTSLCRTGSGLTGSLDFGSVSAQPRPALKGPHHLLRNDGAGYVATAASVSEALATWRQMYRTGIRPSGPNLPRPRASPPAPSGS